MIVSSKMIEAFLDFVGKANAGKWDDEVVELSADDWARMGDVLRKRRDGGYYDFLSNMQHAAQHSIRLEIQRR